MITLKKKISLRFSPPVRFFVKKSLPEYAVISAFLLSFPYCSDAVEIVKQLDKLTPLEPTNITLLQDPPSKLVEKAEPSSSKVISDAIVTPLESPNLLKKVTTVGVIPPITPKTISASSNYNPEQKAAAREGSISH